MVMIALRSPHNLGVRESPIVVAHPPQTVASKTYRAGLTSVSTTRKPGGLNLRCS